MKKLTVYTPTYNRREHLKKAYESLLKQTCSDFLWLIVDDGSDDGTKELVDSFKAENKLEIRYVEKENGGKHTATNRALECCETELIMIALDSDDTLKENAVAQILEDYLETDRKFNGYIYMKENTKGELFVNSYSDSIGNMSWREASVSGAFDGEAVLVLKSSYAKEFSYPVIEGEKFFTEAYVYLQMTAPFFWSRKSIYVAEYLEDGYTKNIMRSFAENPVSYAMFNNMRLEIYTSLVKRIKYAAYYCGFSIKAKKRRFIRESGEPFLAFAALPLGIVFWLLLMVKGK